MFLAHGPLGYSIVVAVKRWFRHPMTRSQQSWLLLAGFFAGIFPDTDLFYYYLFHTEGSHREYFSHTIFFSALLSLCVAILLFVVLKKKAPFFRYLWLVITLGLVSHVLADSLGNGVRWLYPDPRLYGLALVHPFLDEHFFLINFGLEFLFITFFIWHILQRTREKNDRTSRIPRWFPLVCGVLLFIIGETAVLQIHRHSFQAKGETYYGDVDNDHIFNAQDDDVDGDGISNLRDADANGDGISNEETVLNTMSELRGVWFDPLRGSFIDMFLRLGFFLHSDVVYKAYDRSGIYFVGEVHELANERPELPFSGNVFTAKDVRRAENLFLVMQERDLLLPATAPVALADMAFVSSGEMVGIVSSLDETGTPNITMVVPTEVVMEYSLSKVETSIGPVTHWGRPSLGYAPN